LSLEASHQLEIRRLFGQGEIHRNVALTSQKSSSLLDQSGNRNVCFSMQDSNELGCCTHLERSR
jgi:hypothetical protein